MRAPAEEEEVDDIVVGILARVVSLWGAERFWDDVAAARNKLRGGASLH